MHGQDMRLHRAIKPITKIAIAAAVAGIVVFLTTLSPNAVVPVDASAPLAASAKADRLPLAVKGAACSTHGWPDFEKRCQFDFREHPNRAHDVRIIALR
jgi:hypothetical protein